MSDQTDLFFFKCSVSDDLYGASPNANSTPLPTPGGGTWIPLAGVESLNEARHGLVENEAREEISKWGCHWFTSKGSREIYWGPEGPPKNNIAMGKV